jgi:cation transport regulator ChaB
MANVKLSPVEIILEKRKKQKELPAEIYKEIFNSGVEETARKFGVKSEEAVILAYKIVRKNNDFDRFDNLVEKRKIALICDKFEELQTFSTAKIYEECKSFAEIWEVTMAKNILKRKLRREYVD